MLAAVRGRPKPKCYCTPTGTFQFALHEELAK